MAGVAIDANDLIWVIHRPNSLSDREVGLTLDPPINKCCIPAPPVLVFDTEGNLVQSWGGPGEGYDWPENEHGIRVDHNDFVWVSGNGADDHQVLKFTSEGEFVMQIGRAGETGGSNHTELLGRPADIWFDAETNEIYIADGYGNRRIIVFDAETGEYRRHWGAYGNEPHDEPLEPYDPNTEPDQSFRSPVHCVRISNEGHVYVCDRVNNRYQIFEKDGTFITEFFQEPQTLLSGSVSDLDFSRDEAQTFLFTIDGVNNELRIANRETGEILSTIGRPGRYAGQFHVAHDIIVDSQGNIYVTEVNTGQRVQKFVPQE